jgi:hypothetical protein
VISLFASAYFIILGCCCPGAFGAVAGGLLQSKLQPAAQHYRNNAYESFVAVYCHYNDMVAVLYADAEPASIQNPTTIWDW